MSSYLELTTERVKPDDRVIVFFAGHGHTVSGKSAEVGYLVPVDGTPDNLASLIRWDELTRNSELIPAKHILYIMDACYGGLAVTRYISPGSMRFLKDMLQRYSRQVLAAGKADETVADSGGPRSDHSIFTGHLLNALEGEASTKDGILTANGVMAYVYDRVATDLQSRQTPHYGFIDGDGDFIFDWEPIQNELEESGVDKDVLIEIPPTAVTQPLGEGTPSTSELVKEYLSDSRFKIKLDDLVTHELKKTLFTMGDEDIFPASTQDLSAELLAERMRKYEQLISDLQSILILLAKWGGVEHRSILGKIITRLGDADKRGGGQVVWLGLRWYPIQLLMYAGGIAALSSDSYDNLSKIITAKSAQLPGTGESIENIIPIVESMLEVGRTNVFKTLPGHERNHVPLNEYMFKTLQAPLEDLLFLGKSYESLFDRFEVLYALTYADLTYDNRMNVWGPIGRFGWKFSGRLRGTNPYTDILKEAESMKEGWWPLSCGLFEGSYERFKLISGEYEKLLQGLRWF